MNSKENLDACRDCFTPEERALVPEISFLAGKLIGRKGNAYVDATRTRSGATINTIFFDNGGTMKITIKYKPNPQNGIKSTENEL